MTMDQDKQSQEWKHQLLSMGYQHAEVEGAGRAGADTVIEAIDYIEKNKTNHYTADQTDYSTMQHSNQPNQSSQQRSNAEAPTFTAYPETSFSNVRDSLDRIDIPRRPYETSSSADVVENNFGQFKYNNNENMINNNSNSNNNNSNSIKINKQPILSNSNNNNLKQPHSSPINIDDDDQMKRAIELSKNDLHEREMQQVLQISKQEEQQNITTRFNTNEDDPALMKAIAESLKESPINTGDNIGSWQSQGYNNNEDAIRDNLNDPVGLRNIGNTCYLNSLLQVYFHLPDFRRVILSFRCPENFDRNQNEQQQQSVQSSPTTGMPDDMTERKSESTSDCLIAPPSSYRNDITTDTQMKEKTSIESDRNLDPLYHGMNTSTTNNISNMGPPPAPGETSASDKSHNRSERRGESDEISKRHAVEFVIELQRLFAAMALGNKACVDPTAVTRAMRDGDGNPIKIGDQQDASEFNHLFLDIVEKGLRYESELQKSRNLNANEPSQILSHSSPANGNDNGTENNSAPTTSNRIMVAENISTVNDTSQQRSEENRNRNSINNSSSSSTRNEDENVVKDLFTVKFRQEVRRCNQDGTPKTDNGSSVNGSPMVTHGETNCIIVDATTRKERDLYNGLEDYAVARIEYNVGTNEDKDNCSSKESKKSKEEIEGKVSNAALDAIKEKERVASTGLQTLVQGKEVSQTSGGNGDGTMQDIEMQNAQASNWALKSVWLTKLPPVLVIYLQRVRYIREKLIAEKVHDKYEFAPEIALDRYLEKNREATGRARERVSRIRKERRRLTSLVRKYRSFPIQADNVSDSDIAMTPVAPSTSSKGHSESDDMDIGEGELFSAGGRIQKRLLEALNPSSELFAVDGLSKEGVDVAIGTIEKVLENDRKQCEKYERDLSALDKEADVYRGMDEERYRLHAVLVHDGAPSGGHYWTFIRNWEAADGEQLTWIKFNDSMVTNMSEQDMLLWSVGGHGRASAYCLIYTSLLGVNGGANGEKLKIVDECRRLLPESRLAEVEKSRLENTKPQAVTTVAVAGNMDNNAIASTTRFGGVELQDQHWKQTN